jgi:transposase-like protein
MSKILFTDTQVKKLSKNKWIKNITNKGITYTDKFKYKLVKECENYKKFPQDVFRECGIDPDIVGIVRIQNSAYRWRKQLKANGEISDTRSTKSGNTLKHELTDKEQLERAEAKIKLLEAENELLKKNELIEMGILTDIKSISNLKQ